jgi:hypothetical protein
LKTIIDIVCDNKGVIFSRKLYKLFSAGKSHGLPGRIRERRDTVDDVAIDLRPWSWLFEGLVHVSELLKSLRNIGSSI